MLSAEPSVCDVQILLKRCTNVKVVKEASSQEDPDHCTKLLNTLMYLPADMLTAIWSFMQDYRVHIKHIDGSFERIPYFSLPANELNDVIAPSCYTCFDYPNHLADMVII